MKTPDQAVNVCLPNYPRQRTANGFKNPLNPLQASNRNLHGA
jgi:hypothetical protein